MSSLAGLIVEQSAHLLTSALVHSLPSVVPMPQTTLSTSELRYDQSSVSLPAIFELIDYLFVVVLTIVVLPAPPSAVLLLVVLAIKRSLGLLFLIKDSPLMPYLLLLPNRLQHIVIVLLGHQSGQIPPSKPRCQSLFVLGIGKVDQSFSSSSVILPQLCVLGYRRHLREEFLLFAK